MFFNSDLLIFLKFMFNKNERHIYSSDINFVVLLDLADVEKAINPKKLSADLPKTYAEKHEDRRCHITDEGAH